MRVSKYFLAWRIRLGKGKKDESHETGGCAMWFVCEGYTSSTTAKENYDLAAPKGWDPRLGLRAPSMGHTEARYSTWGSLPVRHQAALYLRTIRYWISRDEP